MDVEVTAPDGGVTHDWALNEAALEKCDRARMLEVAIEVDGRAISSFSCDSLVMSTPTGSTAYAYSGGGPVIWPEVEALLLVPLVAHALFTRPLVLGPDSRLEVVIQHAGLGAPRCGATDGGAWRMRPPARASASPARTAPCAWHRLNDAPFATRLVRKFDLPVGLASHRRRRGRRGRPGRPGRFNMIESLHIEDLGVIEQADLLTRPRSDRADRGDQCGQDHGAHLARPPPGAARQSTIVRTRAEVTRPRRGSSPSIRHPGRRPESGRAGGELDD